MLDYVRLGAFAIGCPRKIDNFLNQVPYVYKLTPTYLSRCQVLEISTERSNLHLVFSITPIYAPFTPS